MNTYMKVVTKAYRWTFLFHVVRFLLYTHLVLTLCRASSLGNTRNMLVQKQNAVSPRVQAIGNRSTPPCNCQTRGNCKKPTPTMIRDMVLKLIQKATQENRQSAFRLDFETPDFYWCQNVTSKEKCTDLPTTPPTSTVCPTFQFNSSSQFNRGSNCCPVCYNMNYDDKRIPQFLPRAKRRCDDHCIGKGSGYYCIPNVFLDVDVLRADGCCTDDGYTRYIIEKERIVLGSSCVKQLSNIGNSPTWYE